MVRTIVTCPRTKVLNAYPPYWEAPTKRWIGSLTSMHACPLLSKFGPHYHSTMVCATLSHIKSYIFASKQLPLRFNQWLGDVWHLTSKINKLEVKLPCHYDTHIDM